MGEHDIIRQYDCSIECRCGRVFTASSLEAARADHDLHFHLEAARAALKGGTNAQT